LARDAGNSETFTAEKFGDRIGHFRHRGFGEGSVSNGAVEECKARGIQCIVGGCPLMYCEPVDFGHRCMKWWLRRKGRVPG